MNEFNEGLLKPNLDPLFDEAIALNEDQQPLTRGHEEAIRRNVEPVGIKLPLLMLVGDPIGLQQ